MTKLLAGRHILVVEDEMLVLLLIEDILFDLGCESVSAAATVDRALALIHAQDFDAATLDMNLNGTGTDAVADALAAREVPFVFATGHGTQAIRTSHRERPVLRKPFQESELVSIVTGLVSR